MRIDLLGGIALTVTLLMLGSPLRTAPAASGDINDAASRLSPHTEMPPSLSSPYAQVSSNATLLRSAAPAIQWQETFGGQSGDIGRSVTQTADGGYLVTGSTSSYGSGYEELWLIKTDASGNKLWDKVFGGAMSAGFSLAQTAEGGYVIAGYRSTADKNIWLVKTDANGNKTWDREFGGSGSESGYAVLQTADGGYLAAGETSSHGAGGLDIWLVKTDANGDRVWDRTFGGTGTDSARALAPTTDGGYVIVGYTGSSGAGYSDVWLIKVDATGNKLWDKTFGGALTDIGCSGAQTADGGYIVGGYTYSFGAGEDDVWLIKTDAAGARLWDRTFGGSSWDEVYSVLETADGGFVATGQTWGVASQDMWLIKTDAAGTSLWDATLGGSFMDAGYSVARTGDGGYVVTGRTDSYGAGQSDVWLVKISGAPGPTPSAPVVATDNASGISGRAAALAGRLVDLGSSASAQLSFQWGVTSNYTSETASTNATAPGLYSLYLTGLSENTTYHFRAKGVAGGASYGQDLSFTTSASGGALVVGAVRDARGDPLTANVTADGVNVATTDNCSYYALTAAGGAQTLVARAPGYRAQTRTLTVDNLTATYAVDFKGNDGLVPDRPDLSYVLACINRWRFPADGLGISMSKALSVINAWKFPL